MKMICKKYTKKRIVYGQWRSLSKREKEKEIQSKELTNIYASFVSGEYESFEDLTPQQKEFLGGTDISTGKLLAKRLQEAIKLKLKKDVDEFTFVEDSYEEESP